MDFAADLRDIQLDSLAFGGNVQQLDQNKYNRSFASSGAFLLSGLCTQYARNVILYPFSYCRTHLYIVAPNATFSINPFVALWEQLEFTMKNMNGIRGLYRGYFYSTLMAYPGCMTYFTIYNRMTEYCNKSEYKFINNYFSIPIASVPAAMVSCLIYVPQSIISQKIQISELKPNQISYKSVFNIIKQIYHKDGICKGFFIGLRFSYAKEIPLSIVFWSIYETTHRYFLNKSNINNSINNNNINNIHWFGSILGGALGGIVKGIICNPIDLMRTRVQTQMFNYNEYKIGPLMCKILKNESLKFGFSKGIGAQMIVRGLEGILYSTTFQTIKTSSKYFENINDK